MQTHMSLHCVWYTQRTISNSDYAKQRITKECHKNMTKFRNIISSLVNSKNE